MRATAHVSYLWSREFLSNRHPKEVGAISPQRAVAHITLLVLALAFCFCLASFIADASYRPDRAGEPIACFPKSEWGPAQCTTVLA